MPTPRQNISKANQTIDREVFGLENGELKKEYKIKLMTLSHL